MVKEITNSVNILRDQKLILYPTDTVWGLGLGCDATNSKSLNFGILF